MKVAAFILFMTLSGQLLSQKVVLYEPKTSAKWPIRDNSYSFFIPNTSCDSIIFKCDNGEIVQNKCRIYYTPDSPVNTIFKVYRKEKGKLILVDTIPINVYETRETHARLGNHTEGTISKDEIIIIGGIIALTYISEGHAEGSRIMSYRIITIRGDTIETAVNDGNRYNDKSIILLNKLKPADKLLITEITVRDFRNRVYQVKPIELIVK